MILYNSPFYLLEGIAGSDGHNVAATSAQLHNPTTIVGETIGNLYISSVGAHTIRVVNISSSILKTYAGVSGCNEYSGNGLSATNACFNTPVGLAVDDANSNLYVADFNNNRYKQQSHLLIMIL